MTNIEFQLLKLNYFYALLNYMVAGHTPYDFNVLLHELTR